MFGLTNQERIRCSVLDFAKSFCVSSAGPKRSKSLDLQFSRTKAAYKYKRGHDVFAFWFMSRFLEIWWKDWL